MSDTLAEAPAATPPEPQPPVRTDGSGAIVLARHGEPALSRKVKLSAAEYRAWWALYEEGGLKAGQTPPDGLLQIARDADVIVSSTRQRSVETARAVAQAREVAAEVVMIEAPLPPPRWPGFIKLSPRHWGVVARMAWWFFDHHDGQESRDEAKVRARQAADRLEASAEGGRNVLLLAHGFFNAMIGVELRKRGWRCVQDEGYRYWSARRFVRG